MKKTLLSVVAGLAVIGSSFAVPSLDRQREDCEENPNFVWVEMTKTCVPVNPCNSDNMEIKRAYCDEVTFADISLSYIPALMVISAKEYVRVGFGGVDMKSDWVSEPNYIGFSDTNLGSYMVYKFADANLSRSSATEYLKAYCRAFGGNGEKYYNDKGFAAIDCENPVVPYEVLKELTILGTDKKSENIVTFYFRSKMDCYSYDDCMKE
ncbi:MAG: hypothetical protein J5714_04675 [Alphaproteobacteria bacterium]|nr:hypothetical protein [Alphaproteobacteria bacterium]